MDLNQQMGSEHDVYEKLKVCRHPMQPKQENLVLSVAPGDAEGRFWFSLLGESHLQIALGKVECVYNLDSPKVLHEVIHLG